MKPRLAGAVVAVVAFLALAWIHLHRDAPWSVMAQTVGVLPRTPFRNYCAWFVRDTRVGTIPTGSAYCTWYRRPTDARRAERDEISYNAITRRVRYAERSWERASRDRLRQDLDSVRAALKVRGGVVKCAERAPSTDTEVRELWHFPQYKLLLEGVGGTAFSSRPVGAPRWFLFLHAERRVWRHCPL